MYPTSTFGVCVLWASDCASNVLISGSCSIKMFSLPFFNFSSPTFTHTTFFFTIEKWHVLRQMLLLYEIVEMIFNYLDIHKLTFIQFSSKLVGWCMLYISHAFPNLQVWQTWFLVIPYLICVLSIELVETLSNR